MLVDLEELAVVDDQLCDVAHVVRLVRVVRHDRVELCVLTVDGVAGLDPRWCFEVVLRQEADEVAGVLEQLLLGVGGEMRDAGLGVVGHGAAERLEVDFLTGDGLDDLGSGDEHVRGLLHHEDEVGDRGGVDGAAGARSHDQRDLRHDARAHDVAHEHVAVGAERNDALLDTGAARVVDADHGAADLGCEVHDLAHLLGHDLAEGSAENGEVLAEHAHAAAVDQAVSGDDCVAPRTVLLHVEVDRAVTHESVELLEGARVEQRLDPLARGHLAAGVLLFLRLGGGMHRCLAEFGQVGRPLFKGL